MSTIMNHVSPRPLTRIIEPTEGQSIGGCAHEIPPVSHHSSDESGQQSSATAPTKTSSQQSEVSGTRAKASGTFVVKAIFFLVFAPVVAVAWFAYYLHAWGVLTLLKWTSRRGVKPCELEKASNAAGSDRLEPQQIGVL